MLEFTRKKLEDKKMHLLTKCEINELLLQTRQATVYIDTGTKLRTAAATCGGAKRGVHYFKFLSIQLPFTHELFMS